MKDYLVFRLSAPVLLTTVLPRDIGADGVFRFYDANLPTGSHRYVVQARGASASTTQFDQTLLGLGTATVSPTLRQDGILDVGCLPGEPDTDHDLLCDRVERVLGTNVTRADTDGDGLTDGEEVLGLRQANHIPSNPLVADTDGDGRPDVQSLEAGSNPVHSAREGGSSAWPAVAWTVVLAGVVAGAVVLLRRKRPAA